MRLILGCIVLLASSIAVADSTFDGFVVGDDRGSMKGPRFAFTGDQFFVTTKSAEAAAAPIGDQEWMTARDVDAIAADKKSRWTAADLVPFETACGAAPCPPQPPPGPADWHATALFDGEELIVWHVAQVVKGKAQQAALKKGTVPPPIPKQIDAGAEDLARLFETTLADPKALAASVSTRKDVVLYGNEPQERTVGAAKVKKKLAAWKLTFKVRDGIQAGLTSSRTVGWVAANLDATSPKKPKATPTPYRALFIYEKQGADWKLVNAHFSFVE